VRGLRRDGGGVLLTIAHGVERFDQVVLACHSDQALALLGHAATRAERELLGAIRYQPNRAVLHTDPALLPRDPALWSAWNYASGRGEANDHPVSVTYLINHLQPLPFKTPVMVSLNPQREPAADQVIAEFDYAHPLFDAAALAAQRGLAAISGKRGVWFCGAWTGYGFHEDGLKSALRVANALGCRAPWQGAGSELSLTPAPLAELAA